MIPVSTPTLEKNNTDPSRAAQDNWQNQASSSLKSARQLLDYLGISESSLPYKIDHGCSFKTKISKHFANQINVDDPFDPILLQVIPQMAERKIATGFVTDPLLESQYSPTKGLIHKYQNRVLLIAHESCAIHCRYCFRRHYPYQEQRLNHSALSQSIEYIESHPEVNEVILSGGDPLSLNDIKLSELLERLDALPQLNTVRIHTRTPIVLPERVTKELLSSFSTLKKKLVMVLHINHPNEISHALTQKLTALKHSGALLLNQSVFLKGINDSADIQVALCEKLFSVGVLPYYLHSLDPVKGTHHFQVSNSEQMSIWTKMQARLSGYLLPRLVQELPDKPSKTWINNSGY